MTETDATPVVTGGCLCGAVTYRVTGPLRTVVACHCLQCRKSTGHHMAATSCAKEALRITGDVTWYASSETARRGFCARCGSNLFWDGPGVNISITAGTIDGATGLHLAGHIFCATKGDYYAIADGLPQAEFADATLTTMVAR